MVNHALSVMLVLLVLLTGVNMGNATEPGGQANTMRVISVKPAANDIYAVVSLEYPKSWESNLRFTLEVNGKPVRARKAAGGSSIDSNMADLIFFPKRAGMQNITVKTVVNGRSVDAKSSFDGKQTPFIGVLGHGGDRELLGSKDREITVVSANVAGVRISFNGKDVQGKVSGSEIETLSFTPAWRQGKNVLTVSANKFDGSLIVKNFTFFYPGEGMVLAPGETAVVYCGKEGSKSGPFYDVKIGGDALAQLRDVRTNFFSMDNDGWLVSDPMIGKEFRAQKPGSAVIRIFMKPHFLEKMELDRELTITVR